MSNLAHPMPSWNAPLEPIPAAPRPRTLNRTQWVHVPSEAWGAVRELRQRDPALLPVLLLRECATGLAPDPQAQRGYHPALLTLPPDLAALLDTLAAQAHADVRTVGGRLLAQAVRRVRRDSVVFLRSRPSPASATDTTTTETKADVDEFRQWLTQVAKRATPKRSPAPAPIPFTPQEMAARRAELGFSQRDLAVVTKISRGYIAEIERGARTASHDVRHALAAVLWPAGYPATGTAQTAQTQQEGAGAGA